MAEHARPISATEDRRGLVGRRLEAFGEAAGVRDRAIRAATDALGRARRRPDDAREPLAPVIPLASRARAAWRVLALARRNKTPIGLAAACTLLLFVLVVRRRRRRRRRT